MERARMFAMVHQPGEGFMVASDMLAKAFMRLGFSATF
jgi:hypothetical protein